LAIGMFLAIPISTGLNISCLWCSSCLLVRRQIRRPVCCALILLVIQGIAFVLIMSSLEVLLELLELNILRQLIKVISQVVKEVLMQPLARLFPHINHHLGLLESWSYLLLSDLLCSFDIKYHQALGLDFSIIFITSMYFV